MPKLCLIEGPMKGQTFDLTGNAFFIGRSSTNDIQIKDSTISRKHVKIFRIGKKFFVEDLKSTNGTLMNGEMIAPGEDFEVSDGDIISIGDTMIRLSEVSAGKPLDIKDFVDSNEKEPSRKDRRSRSPKNLELIYKVSELLRQSLNIREILEKVLEYLLDALPRIDRAAILLFDNQEGQVKQEIVRSRQNQVTGTIHYSRTVVDQVVRGGKAVRMSDTAYESPADFSEDTDTLKIGSVLCVPLISKSEIRGAIYVDSLRRPYGFRKEDLFLLTSLSGSVAVAIENSQLALRLKKFQTD
ncbi:MAG: FHA domain-containing protein [Desulfatiglandales bacterium]